MKPAILGHIQLDESNSGDVAFRLRVSAPNEKRPAVSPVVHKMSAPLERQSHWFKVALPSKTAVPLVFDLAQRRDLLRRADTPFDCNSKSKVTCLLTNWYCYKLLIIKYLSNRLGED